MTSSAEGELDEIEEEDEMLADMEEVEQAAPVVPIPAPVEPPVKRKRGRPPKNKPDGKFVNDCGLKSSLSLKEHCWVAAAVKCLCLSLTWNSFQRLPSSVWRTRPPERSMTSS